MLAIEILGLIQGKSAPPDIAIYCALLADFNYCILYIVCQAIFTPIYATNTIDSLLLVSGFFSRQEKME